MGKNLKGKELGEGLSQQKDGFYCARFTGRDGKRKTKRSKKFKECKDWLENSKYEDKHTDFKNLSDITVDGWYNKWIENKKLAVKDGTLYKYENNYNKYIKKNIGDMILVDVRHIHCQNIVSKLGNEGYSKSLIDNVIVTLHNMFDYAIINEIIQNNPCTKIINNGKIAENKKPLTDEEKEKFFENCKGNTYEYCFMFTILTGVRSSELAGLKWSDIDYDNNYIHINRQVYYSRKKKMLITDKPKTKTSVREIPITNYIIEILKLQKEKNKNIKVAEPKWNDNIFLNSLGCPIRNSCLNSNIRSICKKANIREFGIHLLRHTFATTCYENQMSEKSLQMILGHKNIMTTLNMYVHSTDKKKDEDMQMVKDKLIKGIRIS